MAELTQILGIEPRQVADQMKKLRKIFPKLKSKDPNVSNGFVLVDWNLIAPTYLKAVNKVFIEIGKLQGITFSNCQENNSTSDYLKESEKSVSVFQKTLKIEEKGCLVLAGQISDKYLGKSVNEVEELQGENECMLTSFQVGMIILSHFDRIAGGPSLWINCGGDEMRPIEGGKHLQAPFFTITKNKIWFCGHDKNAKVERFITATVIS